MNSLKHKYAQILLSKSHFLSIGRLNQNSLNSLYYHLSSSGTSRKFQNNIKIKPRWGSILPGSTALSGGDWGYNPVPGTSSKGEVPKGLEQFFHRFAVKPTLNLDLVSIR